MRSYLACYYRYVEMRRKALHVSPDPGRDRWDRWDGLPCTAYSPMLPVTAPNIREARRVAPYLIALRVAEDAPRAVAR